MKFLLIILAIVVFIMLLRSILSRKKSRAEESVSSNDQPLSLDNLQAGGILSITGTDYLVEERARYRAGNSEWYEVKLSGDDRTEWWLNWEPGASDVSLTSEIDFSKLGIAPDQLEQFVADGEGEITYDGDTYYLSEFGEADYFQQGSTTGQEVAYCDFYTEDESRTLGIVQWASGAFNAYVGTAFPRRQIEVLRNRGEEEEEEFV